MSSKAETWLQDCDEAGQDGWEMVNYVFRSDGTREAMFKRMLP